MRDDLMAEVDRNFDAMLAMLPDLLASHGGQVALMRHTRIEGYFSSEGQALAAGRDRYADGVFSVQTVTDTVEQLGFYNHAIDPRIA